MNTYNARVTAVKHLDVNEKEQYYIRIIGMTGMHLINVGKKTYEQVQWACKPLEHEKDETLAESDEKITLLTGPYDPTEIHETIHVNKEQNEQNKPQTTPKPKKG